MGSAGDLESEIKQWLTTVLKNENLEDFSVHILGNSEKGDGYMGDIVFVTATGITKGGTTQEYNLVLKCSKRSLALRETAPVKEVFLNEIYVYEKVLPYFIQFQKDKGIEDIFGSVPRCYGSFTTDIMEVIVLQNVKNNGYELWPRKKPLTRKHIDLVVTEYGKFHAVSVALREQRPTEFQELVDKVGNVFKDTSRARDMEMLFESAIDEAYELLKDDLDDNTLIRWKNFKDQIPYIFKEMLYDQPCLQIISHGDCWNNNFMFKHAEGDQKIPVKVVFLDWQVSRYVSPITDLSYFLFSCVSSEDLLKLDDILTTYYNSFINHLRWLGIKEPKVLYPLDQFLEDWKRFSRFGVTMTSLLMKIVSGDKDEVADIAEMAEKGEHFSKTFLTETRDKENYKKRIRPIVEYVVKNNLI